MKILHVVTGLNVGGAESQLCGLIEGLAPLGFEQKVVCLISEGSLTSRIRSHGVECIHLNLRRGRPDLRGVLELRKQIALYRPSIIHAWMYHACIYSSLAGSFTPSATPQLWAIHHSSLGFAGNSLSTVAAVTLCRRLSRRNNVHMVYCAEAARRAHEARGFCRERAVFIPNGYDADKFQWRAEARERIRTQLRIPADRTVFGLVARFDPIKDHATFLAAAGLAVQKHPGKLAIVLVGHGIDESNAALMSLIEKNNLRSSVILVGRRDDIASVYSALDFLVLSSRGEAFPNVICEGMLCELPCISTDVGDCGAIIGDTGFLAPAGSAMGLGTALGQAASLSESERNERAVSARQRILTRYSVEAYVSKHAAVYNRLAR